MIWLHPLLEHYQVEMLIFLSFLSLDYQIINHRFVPGTLKCSSPTAAQSLQDNLFWWKKKKKSTCDDDGVCPGRSKLQRHLMLMLVDSEVVLVGKPLHRKKHSKKVDRISRRCEMKRSSFVKRKQKREWTKTICLGKWSRSQEMSYRVITFTVSTGLH